MFKVGTPIVYISSKKPKRIYHVLKCHASQNWLEFGNVALKQKGKQLKSMFRPATPEEIEVGHRIDKSPLLQHLDKCEKVVKTWPKWKQQSIRDAFGIPNLETLRDCDTSPNCKKYER